MASLESRITGNENFYPTEFLMELLASEHKNKVAKPNRSILDEASKDTA